MHVIRSDLEKEERLKETGANVRVNDSLAIDVVIIDKSLIWYGSVNYLGYNTDENNAIRIYDSILAENIIESALHLTLIFLLLIGLTCW